MVLRGLGVVCQHAFTHGPASLGVVCQHAFAMRVMARGYVYPDCRELLQKECLYES